MFGYLNVLMCSYYILAFWLETAYSRPFLGGFGAYHSQMMSSIVLTPKRHFLARKHVAGAIQRENRSNNSTWAQDREKKTGQDRTGQSKKSQRRYISSTWGDAPTEPIGIKICKVVAFLDVITCPKFWTEIFMGYGFSGGRISDFFIDSCMALQQCSANALPVIVVCRQFRSNGHCNYDVIAFVSRLWHMHQKSYYLQTNRIARHSETITRRQSTVPREQRTNTWIVWLPQQIPRW